LSYGRGVTIGERFPPINPAIAFVVIILVAIGFAQVIAGIAGLLWPHVMSELLGLDVNIILIISAFFLIIGLTSIYAGYLLLRSRKLGAYISIVVVLANLLFSIVYAGSVVLARFYFVMFIVVSILLYIGKEDLE